MTIAHIISDQTLQNLLPLLAYRPDKILQIRSGDSRFSKQANSLRSAALLHSFTEDAFQSELNSPNEPCVAMDQISPTADETYSFFKQLHSFASLSLINITGGTKLMAMGAMKFAEDTGLPWIYVDSPREFVCSNAHQPNCSLLEAAAKLNIRSALAASGLDPTRLKKEDPTDEMFSCAEAIAALRSSKEGVETHRTAVNSIRDAFFVKNKNGKSVIKLGKTLDLALQQAININLSEEVKVALANAQIINRDSAAYFFAPLARNASYDVMKNIVEWNFRFFEGAWYELYVIKRMRESGKFTDVRWSVESKDSTASAGETDIIAFDRRSLSLVFVSCKTSDVHVAPLEHVFAVKQRATQFGGTFATTVFCFATILDGTKRRTLKNACETVRARLVEGLTGIDQWLK